MAENKPFVINDRRKFNADGEPRPDAPRDSSASPEGVNSGQGPSVVTTEAEPVNPRNATVTQMPAPETELSEPEPELPVPTDSVDSFPPLPTAEETAQVNRAYEATVERLDTAIRATNPGADRMPAMTFERLVQSLYMQALIQLGGAPEPGQAPQVDLIGGRQTIDMLAILSDKVHGNLSDGEDKLLQSALFELRMGFLEVTQALSRQAAAARQPGANPLVPGSAGPSIVR